MHLFQPLPFYILLLLMASTINCISIKLTREWLMNSGIIYLSQFPQLLSYFTCFCSFCMAISFMYFYFTKIKSIFYIGSSFSLIAAVLNFYFGMIWLLSPEVFLSSLEEKWNKSINTAILTPIQHKLRCCGFKMIHDVPGDICTESDKNPCLRMLLSTYSSSVRSCGAFCLISAGAHSFLFALFFLTIKQLLKKKRVVIGNYTPINQREVF